MTVRKLTVVGFGLIGGSIAAAARRASAGVRIRAVDDDADTLEYVLSSGMADEALSADAALAAGWFVDVETDLIVLGTPVAGTVEWLRRLAYEGYTGIVTDVASTKTAVVEAARRAGRGYRFVGGHPMAGSERSGVEAASETLFDGAYYILTPSEDTDMGAYRLVHAFAASLGARVVSVDAAAHDEAVAIVSHVPHVAAAALVELARIRAEEAGADLLRLAAGGFKDMTRIAAGSPELWTGICLDNAASVVAGIRGLERVLGEFRESVEAGDAEGVRARLAGAADVRRGLPAQWVPATTRLRELSVPVEDRPGVVGIVTTAVSRAGCNIEDIEIDHQSEDSAVLRLLLTDEGDHEALMAELRSHGFLPQLRALKEDEG
ncbi:MAG: prephenate dehydrogenase/arogenate dehydrogenase family protein [Coriobacteriia bacterium]|nr:prephenate dehydrogenase/arogenate dehydrogenase family protein [Coriobacteriia bacterium]